MNNKRTKEDLRELQALPIESGHTCGECEYFGDGKYPVVKYFVDGELKYCFTQPKDNFVDIEKIIGNADRNDTYTIHVQPASLIKALKAVQKTNKCVKVQFGDKLSPFIVKAKCGKTENWQVVLPARGEKE